MKHLLLSFFLVLLGGCASQGSSRDAGDSADYRAEGRASWYGSRHHGRRTASGERFDQHALTAAHRSLPFGSRVKVTNLANQRNVVVRINDRGPHAHGRIIDLSRAAAERLGMLRSGTARVRVERLAD